MDPKDEDTDDLQRAYDEAMAEDKALAEQQAAATESTTTAAPPAPPAAAPPPPSDAATPPPPPPAAPPPPPPPAEPEGTSAERQALRASRRAERRLQEENARLKAELEARPAADDGSLTDDDIADLERIGDDVPGAAKALKIIQAAPKPAAAPSPPPAADFMPPDMGEAQALIDEIPDLLAFQHDPDQSKFMRTLAMDAYLKADPAWADKSVLDRAKEATNRVIAETKTKAAAPPPPPPPAASAPPGATVEQLRASAQRRLPTTLSDVPGGSDTTAIDADLSEERMAKMSEDELMNLVRTGRVQ